MCRRNNLISCFQIEFYIWVFRFYFPLFSQMSAVSVQERKLLLYLVSFCPPKSINSFMYIQFLGFRWMIFRAVLKETEEMISFLAFLSVLHIKLRSFHLQFWVLWPFYLFDFNKQHLETWSCVCGYCTYRLFFCFRSRWNIPKNARELGMGRGLIWTEVLFIQEVSGVYTFWF